MSGRVGETDTAEGGFLANLAVGPRFGLPGSFARKAAGFVLGGLLAGLIIALRMGFKDALGGRPALLELLLPIMAAAAVGGVWPGLLLLFVEGILIDTPIGSLALSNKPDPARLGAFLLVGTIVALVCEGFHRSLFKAKVMQRSALEKETALRELNADLERRVRERTQELERLNVELELRVEERTRELKAALADIQQVGSELRDARAQEEKKSKKLQAILGSLAEGVVVCDADARLVSVNPVAANVGGAGVHTPIGMSLREYADHVEIFEPNGRPLPIEEWPLSRALRGETFDDCELIVRRIGEARPLTMCYAGRAVLGQDGRVELGVVSIRDVTAQRRASEEREMLLDSERAARAEAERASRLKDEFLATVSHELRTPLTAITGWGQLLQRPGVTAEKVSRGIEVIDRNARALNRLISDLLDVGRIVNGKLVLDVGPVEISNVIEGALESVRHSAEAKEMKLSCRVAPSLTPIDGDAARLQQIVWNLLSNAIKFTPRGGRIEVTCAAIDDSLEIAVRDNGVGIAPEFLPYVFERFRQADASAARRHGGLGLGLAIVRHLVEMHGGWVRVESEGLGAGSRFVVELPVHVTRPVVESSRAGHVEAPPSRTSSVPRMVFAPIAIAGARVLVVEDEADTSEIVRRLLEEHDAEVVTASTAAEALLVLDSRAPHVLVSDLGMPGMDGFALMREIRVTRQVGPKLLPAVALTAFARQEDKRRALASGYQAHVKKPIDPVELVTTVSGLYLMRNG